MKIYAYPADDTGCGYFRIIWPLRELQAQGYDVTIMPPTDRGAFYAEIRNDRVVRVSYPPDADVIVMQRVSHRHLAQAVEVIRREGVAVIMDIDDDLSTIHPNNPAWQMLHPRTGGAHPHVRDHSWHYVDQAARSSTLTTVSSDALAVKYRGIHGARVLRNCVPSHYLSVSHSDSSTIGWCGSAWTHPDDGPDVGPAVARLVAGGERFMFVGPGEYVSTSFGISESDVNATGPLHIDKWPEGVAKIGVGIAPLADTKFNAAKSWLKPLEYSALGIPCVMSPRAEYVRFHVETGLGVLAGRPKEWYRELKKLVTDDAYRIDAGLKARDVAKNLTYAKHAWRWAEVFTEAHKLRQP